jgi:energy-coupling factor transport system permease protein
MAAGATAGGLLAIMVGVYGVLDQGSLPAGGVPFLAVGAVLVGTGLAVGGRRTNRTRYRPDVWGPPEWLVVGSGLVVLGGFVVASVIGVAGLQLVVYPLQFPTLPLLPTACILVGLLPAVAAPAPRALGGARPTVVPVGTGSAATGRPEGSPA